MILHFHSERPFAIKITSKLPFFVETANEEERQGYHLTIRASSTDELDIEIQPSKAKEKEAKATLLAPSTTAPTSPESTLTIDEETASANAQAFVAAWDDE